MINIAELFQFVTQNDNIKVIVINASIIIRRDLKVIDQILRKVQELSL